MVNLFLKSRKGQLFIIVLRSTILFNSPHPGFLKVFNPIQEAIKELKDIKELINEN